MIESLLIRASGDQRLEISKRVALVVGERGRGEQRDDYRCFSSHGFAQSEKFACVLLPRAPSA